MNNLFLTPIQAYHERHRQRLLSKKTFIPRSAILEYSMNKFIMSYNDRDWTWDDEDFSSWFEVGEIIYVIPNAIDNNNETMLYSMMSNELSRGQKSDYLGYLRQNVDFNSIVYSHSQLVPVKIKTIMDLSEDIDSDERFMHDVEIITEDNIRLTLYRDIIFKSQAIIEYFLEKSNKIAENRVTKRYGDLSRIVLNRRSIPHQTGLHSIVKSYVTPRSRSRSRSRGRQGSYIGGKTMKKNKIKNKRTKRNRI